MSQQLETLEAPCPDCNETVALEDPLLGELITCDGCAAELEVRGVAPLTLAPAPEVQEDWGE